MPVQYISKYSDNNKNNDYIILIQLTKSLYMYNLNGNLLGSFNFGYNNFYFYIKVLFNTIIKRF